MITKKRPRATVCAVLRARSRAGSGRGALPPDFNRDRLASPLQRPLARFEENVNTARAFDGRTGILHHSLTITGDNHPGAVRIVKDVGRNRSFFRFGTA